MRLDIFARRTLGCGTADLLFRVIFVLVDADVVDFVLGEVGFVGHHVAEAGAEAAGFQKLFGEAIIFLAAAVGGAFLWKSYVFVEDDFLID